MDQFGQEPSNWKEAEAARQQAIDTIRGQINRNYLNDEELIRYIRLTNVWSYIPDAVTNLFNHKAGWVSVSASDRIILADNGIPTEWFEDNNQPLTYAQVQQRLVQNTLETWLQDRGRFNCCASKCSQPLF